MSTNENHYNNINDNINNINKFTNNNTLFKEPNVSLFEKENKEIIKLKKIIEEQNKYINNLREMHQQKITCLKNINKKQLNYFINKSNKLEHISKLYLSQIQTLKSQYPKKDKESNTNNEIIHNELFYILGINKETLDKELALINQLQQENENLKQQIQTLIQQKQEIKTENNIQNTNEFYNINLIQNNINNECFIQNITIDSIKALLDPEKGWKYTFETFNSPSTNHLVIGILGNPSSYKTTLLNKIFNLNLPQQTPTNSISFITKKSDIAVSLIDTPGLHQPIPHYNFLQSDFLHSKQLNCIIKTFVLSLSSIVFYTINSPITIQVQKELNSIKKQFFTSINNHSRISRTLIIVYVQPFIETKEQYDTFINDNFLIMNTESELRMKKITNGYSEEIDPQSIDNEQCSVVHLIYSPYSLRNESLIEITQSHIQTANRSKFQTFVETVKNVFEKIGEDMFHLSKDAFVMDEQKGIIYYDCTKKQIQKDDTNKSIKEKAKKDEINLIRVEENSCLNWEISYWKFIEMRTSAFSYYLNKKTCRLYIEVEMPNGEELKVNYSRSNELQKFLFSSSVNKNFLIHEFSNRKACNYSIEVSIPYSFCVVKNGKTISISYVKGIVIAEYEIST